jgi:hypothetical protein
MNKKKSDHFDLLPEDSLSRQFLDYSGKRTEMLLTLTKSELKTVTGIHTGHCGLNHFMYR